MVALPDVNGLPLEKKLYSECHQSPLTLSRPIYLGKIAFLAKGSVSGSSSSCYKDFSQSSCSLWAVRPVELFKKHCLWYLLYCWLFWFDPHRGLSVAHRTLVASHLKQCPWPKTFNNRYHVWFQILPVLLLLPIHNHQNLQCPLTHRRYVPYMSAEE